MSWRNISAAEAISIRYLHRHAWLSISDISCFAVRVLFKHKVQYYLFRYLVNGEVPCRADGAEQPEDALAALQLFAIASPMDSVQR